MTLTCTVCVRWFKGASSKARQWSPPELRRMCKCSRQARSAQQMSSFKRDPKLRSISQSNSQPMAVLQYNCKRAKNMKKQVPRGLPSVPIKCPWLWPACRVRKPSVFFPWSSLKSSSITSGCFSTTIKARQVTNQEITMVKHGKTFGTLHCIKSIRNDLQHEIWTACWPINHRWMLRWGSRGSCQTTNRCSGGGNGWYNTSSHQFHLMLLQHITDTI